MASQPPASGSNESPRPANPGAAAAGLFVPLALIALFISPMFFAADHRNVGVAYLIETGAAPEDYDPHPIGASRHEGDELQVIRPGEQPSYNQRQSLWYRGRVVYNQYCVGCHGVYGDGNGPASDQLITQARDFTSGIYKFRSTDSSSLPMDSDLHQTLRRGLARVSMPAFNHLPEHDLVAVVEYIKRFYPRWDEQAPDRERVFVPNAPVDLLSAERIQRGELVYIGARCGVCHGHDGAGTGATQIEYTDAWGNPQKAFNFTRGSLKGGNNPEDIFRTFRTGLRSIMPAFNREYMYAINQGDITPGLDEERAGEVAELLDTFPATRGDAEDLPVTEQDALDLRNSWDLVAYVISLRQD